MGWLGYLWDNGHRPLVLAFVCFVFSVAFLGLVYLIATCWPQEAAYEPLSVEPFVITIRNRVEGVDGPSAHLGEALQGSFIVCNSSDKFISVVAVSQWQKVGTDKIVAGNTWNAVRMPGCETITREIFPVEGLIPGIWVYQITYELRADNHVQRLTVNSEPFELVP